MTYSADTPILGRGTVSAEAIQAWFASLGPAYASYAPDGRYQPPPAGLGAAIVAECQRYAGQTVGWDMVAAQIVHETAAWQSRYARERNNPGGIGAINADPDQAITFPSVDAGVRAHVAHLLVYAVGDGPWRGDDPRYDAVRRAGWLGVALRWGDLNGRWAYPGTTYAQQIAALANRLVTFANDGTWEVPAMAGDDPRFQWIPDVAEFGYPAGTRGRGGKPIDYGIVHITEGSDSLVWLLDKHESSTHYLTDRAMRPRAQLVREADAAWTAGSREYNLRGINIEAEKRTSEPWRRDEITALAETTLPIWQRNGIPLAYLGRDSAGKRGLIGHSDVPDGSGGWGGTAHHTDPGASFDWPFYIAELRRLAVATDTPPAYREFPETGHGIGGGFKFFWEHNGGLPIFGYPLTDEMTDPETGLTIQYFERAVFEYHPENDDPWQVLLRRLGAEELARRERAT